MKVTQTAGTRKKMNSHTDDITKELTPLQVVSLYALGALRGGWRMWAVRWDWDSNKAQASIIVDCLKDFGITNEMISNTKEYKEVIDKWCK